MAIACLTADSAIRVAAALKAVDMSTEIMVNCLFFDDFYISIFCDD
jgi:hypothetical protein